MANTHPIALSELVRLIARLPDVGQEERLRITLPPPPPSASIVAEGTSATAGHTEFHRSGDGESWLFRGDVVLDGPDAPDADHPGLAHALRERVGPRCEEVEVASVRGACASVLLRIAGTPAGDDAEEPGE